MSSVGEIANTVIDKVLHGTRAMNSQQVLEFQTQCESSNIFQEESIKLLHPDIAVTIRCINELLQMYHSLYDSANKVTQAQQREEEELKKQLKDLKEKLDKLKNQAEIKKVEAEKEKAESKPEQSTDTGAKPQWHGHLRDYGIKTFDTRLEMTESWFAKNKKTTPGARILDQP